MLFEYGDVQKVTGGQEPKPKSEIGLAVMHPMVQPIKTCYSTLQDL